MSDRVRSKVREKYVQRFADMLESLQSRLAELEQNLNSIKDDHPGKQKTRLVVLTEINKTKENIENTKNNLEYSKTIPINRSDKVPENIPDHNVWNDCWYDEDRNLFVTFNQYFMEGEDAWTRPHQQQYTEKTGIKAVIILPEQIEFRFGYPAMLQKNSKNDDVWFLIPTMNDTMLTKEIVKARAKPNSQKDALLYKTQSEQWITVGTDGFSICEKENELCDKLGIFPPVPIDELKTLFNRK